MTYSPDTRNYTPNIINLKSFEANSERNFTSDSHSFKNPISQNHGRFAKPIDFHKHVLQKCDNKVTIKVPNHTRLVYITPYDYNKNKGNKININNPNVFKIPSQRVLVENSAFNWE